MKMFISNIFLQILTKKIKKAKVGQNKMQSNKPNIKPSHLHQPQFQNFLKLCNSHLQIGTKLGNSKKCSKTSLMCSNCQVHSQSGPTKHQYIKIQQFAETVKNIRHKYRQFHQIYIKQAMPAFIEKVKNAVYTVFKVIGQWDQSTVLLHRFLGAQVSQKIKNVLLERVQDWDLAQFTCEDMFQLKFIQNAVKKYNSQALKQKCCRDLNEMLKKSFKYHNILLQQAEQTQQAASIKGKIEAVTKKIQLLKQSLQTFQQKYKNKQFPFHLELDSHLQKYNENNFKKVIGQEMQEQIQQKQRQMLGKMVQQLFEYIQKSYHQSINLRFKIQSENQEFWDFVNSCLINFLHNKANNFLQRIVFYCDKTAPLLENLCKQLEKQNIQYEKLLIQVTDERKQKNSKSQIKKSSQIIRIGELKIEFIQQMKIKGEKL